MQATGTYAISSEDFQALGAALSQSLNRLISEIPGTPHRPTALAGKLDISRVSVSKLLSALQRPSAFEVLEALPGPETLRAFAIASGKLGVSEETIEDATDAIDSFSNLIQDRFGTRAALNAALSGRSDSLRTRIDHAGRSEVFRGMRKVLGVETKTWLTSMFFIPSTSNEDGIEVTTLHGAIGLRRLRPDTPVYFTFGDPYRDPDSPSDLSHDPISLQEYYTNEPASLETQVIHGQVRHKLAHNQLGKKSTVDMLALCHDAFGSSRYGTTEAPLRGASVLVDIPAHLLVCDIIVHKDLFPDSDPSFIVYNIGAHGPANPNDPTRDVDKIEVSETPEFIPHSPERFDVPEIPNYSLMVRRVTKKLGQSISDLRVYRLRMIYPITSFQFVIAFDAPLKPEV